MNDKLSIITINRNNALGLRKTIESVVCQTYKDFEYIVVDGASIDGSVEVIKEYAEGITYWVSEPDNGIYNAMNKGILKAKGEYLLFLNSGDWLVDNDLVSDFCNSGIDEDIVCGNLYLWDSKDNSTTLIKAVEENEITYDFFMDNIIYHQSSFIRSKLFVEAGLYSENYKIVSDWEFFIRAMIIQNCSYKRYDRVIVYFAIGGISSQNEWMNLHLNERENVFQSLPRIHKMYLKINEQLGETQRQLDEYQHLKNGSLGGIVRILLWVKNIKKRIRWK